MTRREVAGFFLVLLFTASHLRFWTIEGPRSSLIVEDRWLNCYEFLVPDDYIDEGKAARARLDAWDRVALFVGIGLAIVVVVPDRKRCKQLAVD